MTAGVPPERNTGHNDPMGHAWIDGDGTELMVRVWLVPGASRSGVVGAHGDALKIRVSAPPERGRANAAAVALLREALRPAVVELVSGESTRRKTFAVRGLDAPEVVHRLTG